MLHNQIQLAIDKLPELHLYGVGFYQNEKVLTSSEHKELQQQLLDSTEEFEKACLWLEKINKIKTINKQHSSYGLKHLAEDEIGYISNGTFIAAAINCGFNYKASETSPNVSFNMSEKDIKSLSSET